MEAPIPGVSIGSMRLMVMSMVEGIARDMLGAMRRCFGLVECRSLPPAVTSGEAVVVVVVVVREERSAFTARTLLV